MIEKWKRLGQKVLLDLRIMKVLEIEASSARGVAPHPFYVFDTVDWINVLPITADGQVVFVRQYRHGSDEISLEIPGGMVRASSRRWLRPVSVWRKVAFGQRG